MEKMETQKIFSHGKEIVLVGTAHISRKSAELVKKTIEKESPDAIGVELDEQRYSSLSDQKKWKETDIIKIVNDGKAYLFLANILLSNFQRRTGEKIGAMPGMEMLEATKIAEEKKIPVALLDRDIGITMKRALSMMGLVEKAKIVFTVFFSLFAAEEKIDEKKIEELKKKDYLNALMQELARELPKAKKVLVDERDVFIANRILEMPGKKVVAIVGIGHVEGIKKHLQKKQDTTELLAVPKKRNYSAIIKFAIPAVFVLLIFLAFTNKGTAASINIIIAWFLITGLLSAAGVLIARGHPLSALAALAGAPFAALHPAIAVGWIAGYVEARIRAPKVRDFENLQGIKSYSGLSHNAVTRILLVVALANLGSMAGTIIAFSYIAGLIA